jgi:outer membrane protein, multidrug efflux system
MRKTTLWVLFVLWQGEAFAQAPPTPDPTPTRPSLALEPAESDPTMAPVPPPKRVLSSWREAVALFLSRSTDMRTAFDEILKAEAQTRIALAQFLPSITGTGSYTRQLVTRTNEQAVPTQVGSGFVTSQTAPVPKVFLGSLQVQQSLVNIPALDRISIDELGEDASKLSADDRKRTLLLSLANQIVAVVAAERGTEINRVGLRVALELIDLVQRKQALGAGTILDVVRAQENAEHARDTLVSGDESLREARESLGLAIGYPQETGVAHDFNVGGIAENAMTSCRTVGSIDERSDVAAARMGLEVAKRNLRNVWLGFAPTLVAQSTLTEISVVPDGYPNPTWDLVGLLTVPIWDGGAIYGQVKNARATADIATQNLEALRRQGTIQVEQAQRELAVAQESYKIGATERDLAAKNDRLTQIAYIAGQATSLELVTASEAHREAELSLALRDFAILKARLLAVLALATCAR